MRKPKVQIFEKKSPSLLNFFSEILRVSLPLSVLRPNVSFYYYYWRNEPLRCCVIERPCWMCGSGALPVLDDQSSQRWQRSHSIWASVGLSGGEGVVSVEWDSEGGLGSFSLVSWRGLMAWQRVEVRKKCKRTARAVVQGSRGLCQFCLREGGARSELVVLKNFARLNNLPTREYHAH